MSKFREPGLNPNPNSTLTLALALALSPHSELRTSGGAPAADVATERRTSCCRGRSCRVRLPRSAHKRPTREGAQSVASALAIGSLGSGKTKIYSENIRTQTVNDNDARCLCLILSIHTALSVERRGVVRSSSGRCSATGR